MSGTSLNTSTDVPTSGEGGGAVTTEDAANGDEKAEQLPRNESRSSLTPETTGLKLDEAHTPAGATAMHPTDLAATVSADSGVSVGGGSTVAPTPSDEQNRISDAASSLEHRSSDEDLPDLVEEEDETEARLISRRKRLRLDSDDSNLSDASSTTGNNGPGTRSWSPIVDPDEPYPVKSPHWNHVIAMRRREHGVSNKRSYSSFAADCCDSHFFVRRLELMYKMDGHKGCVNSLNFNRSGTRLLSGSDDLKVAIWDWTVNQPLTVFQSGHRGNVFQTKYLPGDAHIVTAARDGQVRLADLSVTGECRGTRRLAQHRGAVHKVSVACDNGDETPLVLSCGEDGMVNSIDLRDDKPSRLVAVKDAESGNSRVPLYSIHTNPTDPHVFAVGGRDQFCRLYDRRSPAQPLKSFCPAHLKTLERHKANVTGAVFSYDGSMILATYNDEDIYCFETSHSDGAEPIHRYKVKSVAWMGARSRFVMSGSDCGHLYIWDRDTEQILQMLYADETGVVNTMEMNPRFPMIASSGLDSDVKIWVPSDDKYNLDVVKMRKFTRRNARERAEEAEHSVDGMFSTEMLQFIMSRYRAGRLSQPGDEDSSPDASDSSDEEGGGSRVIGCRTS